MSTAFLNQLGVIPAILITLTGLVMLRGADVKRAARRFLLYLLGVGVFLLLVLLITMRFLTEPYNQPFFQLSSLLAPSVSGITTLIVLNAKGVSHADRKTKNIAVALGLVMAILFGLLWNSKFEVGYLILPGVLPLVIGWVIVLCMSQLNLSARGSPGPFGWHRARLKLARTLRKSHRAGDCGSGGLGANPVRASGGGAAIQAEVDDGITKCLVQFFSACG